MRGNGPLSVQECCSWKWRHAFVFRCRSVMALLIFIKLLGGDCHLVLSPFQVSLGPEHCRRDEIAPASPALFRLAVFWGEFHRPPATNWDVLIRSAEVGANAWDRGSGIQGWGVAFFVHLWKTRPLRYFAASVKATLRSGCAVLRVGSLCSLTLCPSDFHINKSPVGTMEIISAGKARRPSFLSSPHPGDSWSPECQEPLTLSCWAGRLHLVLMDRPVSLERLVKNESQVIC